MNFKNKIILAPMADINDAAFRALCKRYGADIVFSEMINPIGLNRKNSATFRKTFTVEEERPIALQLFGSRINQIVKAAKLIEDKCDFIDFNFGCPSGVIVRQGAGVALMRRPKKVFEIIQSLVNSVNVPVTAKIRSGYQKKNYLEIANQIEKAGASAITVHPRTMSQGYQGISDWKIIKELKENLSIPVIGNGDIIDEESAVKMFEQTGCDSIMIGRAALGYPYIFKRIKHFMKTGKKLPELDKDGRLQMYVEYLSLAKKFGVEDYKTAKVHAMHFVKDFPNSSKMRAEISQLKSFEKIRDFLKS